MTLQIHRQNAGVYARGGAMGRTANLLIAGEPDQTGPMARQLTDLGFKTATCSIHQSVTELTGHRYDGLVSFGHIDHELTPPGVIHVHIGSAADGVVDARMRLEAVGNRACLTPENPGCSGRVCGPDTCADAI